MNIPAPNNSPAGAFALQGSLQGQSIVGSGTQPLRSNPPGRAHLRPGLDLMLLTAPLREYLLQPQASIDQVPLGLQMFRYGSTSVDRAGLLLEGIEQDFIAAYVPTPKAAGELRDVGLNNFSVKQWLEQIDKAVVRNGGLGSSEDGFLAWSKAGFIRLRNPRLTPEQNRRFAAMSLQLGVEVENLPARSTTSSANPSINRWREGLLEDYETKLINFQQNPSEGLRLRDGKRRFGLSFNDEYGVLTSYYYKKRSGLKRLGRKAIELGGKALQLAGPSALLPGALSSRIFQSMLFKNLPGFREINKKIDAVFQKPTVRELLSLIDPPRFTGELLETYGKGKATLRQVTQAALVRATQSFDMLPAFDPFSAAIKGIGMLATRLLRGANVYATDVVNAIAAFIPGLPGVNGLEQAAEITVRAGAAAIDDSD